MSQAGSPVASADEENTRTLYVASEDSDEDVGEAVADRSPVEKEDDRTRASFGNVFDTEESEGTNESPERTPLPDLSGDEIEPAGSEPEAHPVSPSGQPSNVGAEEQRSTIEIQVPVLEDHLGEENYFIKLPNFVSIEPQPFDPETFEMEPEEDQVMDEEGRKRVKLKVENTIRWRKTIDDKGNVVPSSNAKLVRYSDNSFVLFIGAEPFDVRVLPMVGDFRQLFIRQGNGLQAVTKFEKKLAFRPSSMNSFTHQRMTRSIVDRASKAQRVKVLPSIGKDPELLKQQLIKQEEERLRTKARKESQQRRIKERSQHRGLSSSYLEPDRFDSEEEADVSLSAIKRKFKTGAKDYYQQHQQKQFSSSDSEASVEDRYRHIDQSKILESDEGDEPSFTRVIEDDDED
uniref:RNA polymerase-associated protein LEO1 n=1 Tax=Trichuris muris TaxID=70415 RepID=A0A5S6R572_TRIMR